MFLLSAESLPLAFEKVNHFPFSDVYCVHKIHPKKLNLGGCFCLFLNFIRREYIFSFSMVARSWGAAGVGKSAKKRAAIYSCNGPLGLARVESVVSVLCGCHRQSENAS